MSKPQGQSMSERLKQMRERNFEDQERRIREMRKASPKPTKKAKRQ